MRPRGGPFRALPLLALALVASAVPAAAASPRPVTVPAALAAETPPGAVLAPAVVPSSGSLALSWSAPSSGGAAASYDVELQPGEVVRPVSDTSTVLRGLANATPHEVRVRAVNAAGAGPWSPAASGTPNGCAGTRFSDVAPTHPFCAQIGWMATQGISTGTTMPDGSVEYRPALDVSRQAMAPFIFRTKGSPEFAAPAASPFADVPTNHPFFKDIAWMRARGISTGTPQPTGEPLYKPAEPVSRQAMAPFLYRAAGSPPFTAPTSASFADVASSHPFFREIEWMRASGISTGTAQPSSQPLYKPIDPVSRQAMAAFLNRFAAMGFAAPVTPLQIGTAALVDGTAGLRYLQPLDVTGGFAPHSWAATGLPAGLALTAEGVLEGTPTAVGTADVTVTVTDAAGTRESRSLPLVVADTLPAECVTTACSLVTSNGATVELPASAVVAIGRDAAGAVSTVEIRTAPPTVDAIVVVAPTPDAPSGLTARVDSVTAGPGGTTILGVTPGTPADAYAEGTVKSDAAPSPDTSAPTSNALAASSLSCTNGVSSSLHGLTVTPDLTPSMTAIWKHPVAGVGGFYVGPGGLELMQFDLTGTLTADLGVTVSGSSTCTLRLPEVRQIVPAGNLGAIVLVVTPTLTLEVTGKVDLRTSATLTCGTQYRWSKGREFRGSYCSGKHQPLGLTAATGVDATLTGALAARVTLNEIGGITGDITAALHAGWHPTSTPVSQLDATVSYRITACLACFWKGSPAQVSLVDGTLLDKVLYRSGSSPDPVPTMPVDGLRITTSALPDGSVGQSYAATLTAQGGRAPYTWSLASGALPNGLSLAGSGRVTGTATGSGRSTFTATVTDQAGTSVSRNLSITVREPQTGAVAIVPGGSSGEYACALLGDGTARCWGDNYYGQLGDGTTTDRTTPVAVRGLSGAVSLTPGDDGMCALLGDGTARCWGSNNYGQLGDGTTIDRPTPVVVSGLSGAVGLTSHSRGMCALLGDGTARCWGDNRFGQLGDGTTATRLTPVPVSGLSGAVSLNAHSEGMCALLGDGTARCWGENYYGRGGYVAITGPLTPVAVSGLSGAVSLTSNEWGNICALLGDGTARCWGDNRFGQLGDGTTTYPDSPLTSVAVSGLSGAVSLTSHTRGSFGDSTCALLGDGTTRCWGSNRNGQLGDGTTTDRRTPVAVSGLSAAVSLTSHSFGGGMCALLGDGTARCWGANQSGQLGDGTTTTRLTPVVVSGLSGAVSLTSRGESACALLGDGTARCWGENYAGQLGDGTTTDRLTPVAVIGLQG